LKLAREFRIGAVAVATLLLFIWGVNYLKGTDIFTRQITYYAIYDEITGLIESNPVTMNGVTLGQVSNISFHPDGSGRIIVECIILKSVPIPVNSISALTSPTLTGSRHIKINRGDAGTFIKNGDTLTSSIEPGLQDEALRLMEPIKERAENIFLEIDSLLQIVKAVVNEQTQKNITNSFNNIDLTLASLRNTAANLHQTISTETPRISAIMTNAESITQNLKNNNEALSNILKNASLITDSIAAANLTLTLAKAEESIGNLNSVLEKINNGEGTVGMLMNDEQLYNNLAASSHQLELLLQDIRENPAKYLRISVLGR